MSQAPPLERRPPDVQDDVPAMALMGLGVAALLHVLLAVGRAAVPLWQPSILLPILAGLVSSAAFYRTRWTRLYRPFGGRAGVYAAEVILLVLLVRIVPLLLDPARLAALASVALTDPLALIDGAFVVDSIVVAIGWVAGNSFGTWIDQLHIQPGEIAPPRGSVDREQWERSTAAFDHRGARQYVATTLLFAILTAVLALAILCVTSWSPGLLVEGVVATVVVVGAALLLLAWSQVALLDTLWRLNGLTVPAALRQRWGGWLALVLIAMGLVALVLPRAYSVDPLALLVTLMAVVASIVQLLFFALMWPFVWLASLFGADGSGGAAGRPSMPPPMASSEQGELPFLDTMRSLGFWLLTLGLAFYSLRTLHGSRWGLFRFLPRWSLWGALVRAWRALLAGFGERAAALVSALRPALASQARAILSRSSRPARPVDARGWILYLYVSLIDRAGRRGFRRRRGMTAAEYSQSLAYRLATAPSAGATGEAADEPRLREELHQLDELTSAFMAARYSRQPVAPDEVSRARVALQAVLALIRRASTRR